MVDNIIVGKITFSPGISHHVQFVYFKVLRIIFFSIVYKRLSNIRSCAGDQDFFLCLFINADRFSESNSSDQLFFCFSVRIITPGSLHRSCSAFYYRIIMSYFCHCSEQAFQIKYERAVPYTIAIQYALLFNGDGISAIDLCPSGNARLIFIYTVLVSLCGQYILIPQPRSGSYQRQGSIHHVKQLWKLIQGMRTQELSDSCNILLRIFQHMSRGIMRCRHFHAAELVYPEILLILSQSLLGKKYRTGIIDLNGNCDPQQQRRQCHNAAK